ncbi:YncE family protein [Salinimonas lutimaris]|uniref:YncE family protein n=1 Tax=Salinimonas lutimaris TaxID=914153 RepID=UPI0010C08AD5|nr:hypothetical protein [Salinimonas lutimaris]
MTITTHTGKTLSLMVLAATISALLAGCDGDDGQDGMNGADGADGAPGADGSDGAAGLPVGRFLIANNGDDNRGTVSTVDQNAAQLSRFDTGANEGLVLTSSGRLIQAGDADEGILRTVCQVDSRQGAAFTTGRDKQISGSNTGLTNPKGIAFADAAGLIMVADFNGMRVSVFGGQAAGDVAPVAEIDLPAKPWDLAYDESADRLFVALTDGSVAVYDDVAGSDFAPSVMRSIVPADAQGNPLSVNLHGIVYEPRLNRLVLSDVGDAAVADDGQLFVIDQAATADGATTVSRVIGGPATMLGNPVDITLTGSTLRVAEKSNDAILVFNNIFSGPDGDVRPDLSTPSVKPESVAELSAMPMMTDASDNALAVMALAGISVSSNPAAQGDTTGQVSQFSATLGSELAEFDSTMAIESAAYMTNGDGFITFSSDTGGGVMVVNRLASMRDDGAYSMSMDTVISGESTGLVSPKGLDVNSQMNVVMVADFNETTPAVRVFSGCASGDVAPLMTLVADNDARPWDVDYDSVSDTAYVALTNGTVAVFDEVSRKLMAGQTELAGEDRLIVPAINGTAVTAPTNIHGIDYDGQSNSLILSDVGSAADATDGKLYVIPGAAMADGLTDISVSIAGPLSQLGNPVDVMVSNGHVYVAEKSNNVVMRFDNIVNRASGDVAADFSVSFTAPESVAVLPVY